MEISQQPLVTKKEIWETLSQVNVNEHTEKVGQFTYLSWAWAIEILMQHYPNSSWKFLEDLVHGDGTKEVRVELNIEGNKYYMWLAVFDYKNKPIPNPKSTDVANQRMRCLTKAIAVAGLGFYIYRGEDLPIQSKAGELTSPKGSKAPNSDVVRQSVPQPNLLRKADYVHPHDKTQPKDRIIPVSKGKGKKYGEVFKDPKTLANSIKYWKSNAKSEEALKHLTNLQALQVINGVESGVV